MTARVGAITLCAAALLLGGCGGYTLRGKVIDGPASQILVVDKDDPRLGYIGIGGATVQVTVDPESLGRTRLPGHPAADDGSFDIPIDQPGAGLLEYDVGVVVRHEGHDSAVKTLRLPGGNKRLLVFLARGPDSYRPTDDPLREAEPFLRGQ